MTCFQGVDRVWKEEKINLQCKHLANTGQEIKVKTHRGKSHRQGATFMWMWWKCHFTLWSSSPKPTPRLIITEMPENPKLRDTLKISAQHSYNWQGHQKQTREWVCPRPEETNETWRLPLLRYPEWRSRSRKQAPLRAPDAPLVSEGAFLLTVTYQCSLLPYDIRNVRVSDRSSWVRDIWKLLYYLCNFSSNL